jgi:EAL domain-containing protein (putative c-di-GMP-specific phosphodiesterase class I)
LILEVTEGAMIKDPARFVERINTYRGAGVRLAIDDFGAGYAGLNLLAEFQPDIVKLDMGLVRDIDNKGPRHAIARALIQACNDLGLEVLAEGIESPAEFNWFAKRGVRLFQGFLFGRPAFRQIVAPAMPMRPKSDAARTAGPL